MFILKNHASLCVDAQFGEELQPMSAIWQKPLPLIRDDQLQQLFSSAS